MNEKMQKLVEKGSYLVKDQTTGEDVRCLSLLLENQENYFEGRLDKKDWPVDIFENVVKFYNNLKIKEVV